MQNRFVGHENQLLTARRLTYTEGLSQGVRAIELRNSSGLYATCIEDQCLNLYDFSYKGINFMELQRKVFFPAEGKYITYEDVVINREPQPVEFELLYHINLGYPLLSPESRVVKGAGGGYSIHTKGPIPENWAQCWQPEDHKDEDLFCHENTPDKDGFGYTALLNAGLGLGCYIKYDMKTLPWLMHWRNMCSHDYALGLEPSNNQVLGRDAERKNGTLQTLGAYESRTFRVELGVLDGHDELTAFESMLQNLK